MTLSKENDMADERQVEYVREAAAIASACLFIFEEYYPEDSRPRKAIMAAYAWADNPSPELAEAARLAAENADQAYREANMAGWEAARKGSREAQAAFPDETPGERWRRRIRVADRAAAHGATYQAAFAANAAWSAADGAAYTPPSEDEAYGWDYPGEPEGAISYAKACKEYAQMQQNMAFKEYKAQKGE